MRPRVARPVYVSAVSAVASIPFPSSIRNTVSVPWCSCVFIVFGSIRLEGDADKLIFDHFFLFLTKVGKLYLDS